MKKASRSKTIGVNGLVLLALFFPKVREWTNAHPSETIALVSLINVFLRLITKDKIKLELPNMKLMAFLAAIALLVGACNSLPIDQSVNAAEAGARTVVLGGCGVKANSKYLYCEKNEGNALNDGINLFVPLVDCKRDSCTRVQFFRKDGSNGPSGSIPKGKMSMSLTLGDLVGDNSGDNRIKPAHDGEYGVLVQTFYTGNDGEEFSMLSKGLVRVSVVLPSYRPLACADPNVAWTARVGDKCEAQFSTAYRSAVCGEGCK